MLKNRQLLPVIVDNSSMEVVEERKLTPEQELKLVRSSIRKSCKESENAMKQELNRNGEILIENISAISMSLIDGAAAKEMIGQSAKEFVKNDTAIEVTDQGIIKTIQNAKNLLKLMEETTTRLTFINNPQLADSQKIASDIIASIPK